MIELGKKYKLKKIRGFENSDNEYYKVACGERFVFMKEFLINPQKPDEIYSDLILERNK